MLGLRQKPSWLTPAKALFCYAHTEKCLLDQALLKMSPGADKNENWETFKQVSGEICSVETLETSSPKSVPLAPDPLGMLEQESSWKKELKGEIVVPLNAAATLSQREFSVVTALPHIRFQWQDFSWQSGMIEAKHCFHFNVNYLWCVAMRTGVCWGLFSMKRYSNIPLKNTFQKKTEGN